MALNFAPFSESFERPGYDLFTRTQKGRDVMGMGFVEAIFQLESRDHHDDSNYSEALCVVQDYIREIIAREAKEVERLKASIPMTRREKGDRMPNENENEGAVEPIVIAFDDFHYHELMDRCNIICDMIETTIIEHPAAALQMKTWAEDAQRQLYNLANMAETEQAKFPKS